jgi:hypothetical protein
MLIGGCPQLPVGDPYAEARITNDTTGVIDIELTLDAERYGENGSDASGAQQQLHEFLQGEGVTLTSEDVAGLTATYQVSAGGMMLVYQGMGTEAFFPFTRLTVTRDGKAITVESEPEIRKRFVNREGNLYELRISDM